MERLVDGHGRRAKSKVRPKDHVYRIANAQAPSKLDDRVAGVVMV